MAREPREGFDSAEEEARVRTVLDAPDGTRPGVNHGTSQRREPMYTVIRTYTGARGFADDLKKRSKEIESVIGGVTGFVAYYLIKTDDGALSVTVCENRNGCDESTRRAADWIRKNMPDLKISPPQVTGGELAFRFATYQTKV
jgi:hypothetical protein